MGLTFRNCARACPRTLESIHLKSITFMKTVSNQAEAFVEHAWSSAACRSVHAGIVHQRGSGFRTLNCGNLNFEFLLASSFRSTSCRRRSLPPFARSSSIRLTSFSSVSGEMKCPSTSMIERVESNRLRYGSGRRSAGRVLILGLLMVTSKNCPVKKTNLFRRIRTLSQGSFDDTLASPPHRPHWSKSEGESRTQKCQRMCQQEPSRRVRIGYPRLTNVSFEYQAKTPVYYSDLSAKALVSNVRQEGANDPSSATRPARAFDCNSDAMAGFAAVHG